MINAPVQPQENFASTYSKSLVKLGALLAYFSVFSCLCFGFEQDKTSGSSTVATVKGDATTVAATYTVEAIRYATIPAFHTSYLIAGADPNERADIAMMFWLVRGNGKTILVDTGFSRPQWIKSWNVQNFEMPTAALGRLGVAAEAVTDIIVTHMHFDHVGGIELFPNAHVWIQKDEYTYYTGAAWQSHSTHTAIDPEDVFTLVKKNVAGGVSFIEGDDAQIFPGIRAYTGGRHTFASQFLGIRTRSGTVVLASDDMYLDRNRTQRAAVGITFDAASNLRAQDRMLKLASDPRLIVPGHDPAVFTRFQAVAANIVEIR